MPWNSFGAPDSYAIRAAYDTVHSVLFCFAHSSHKQHLICCNISGDEVTKQVRDYIVAGDQHWSC